MWRRTACTILVVAVMSGVVYAQVPPPPSPPMGSPPAPEGAPDTATQPIVIPGQAGEVLTTAPDQPLTKLPAIPKPKPKKPSPPKLRVQRPVADVEHGLQLVSSAQPPSFRCFVRDVMAFYDRTHVRCYNKTPGNLIFFAVDTSQPIAATVLAKALKAMQLGKPVTVTYAPTTDLNPTNCNKLNCRRLLDIRN